MSTVPEAASGIHVVGAAILSGARCFVAQRSETMPLPLQWEFPGGKVEDGEDPRGALRREIAEELGLEVEVGEFLGRGVVGEVTLDVYLARRVAGEIALHEHRAGRWVTAEEIEELDWAAADVPVLGLLREALARREE